MHVYLGQALTMSVSPKINSGGRELGWVEPAAES